MARSHTHPKSPSSPQSFARAVFDLMVQVPPSAEQPLENPRVRAQAIGRAAARKASLVASSLSLPPGLLGWLTVAPELVAVWKLQAQMVSDIAQVYGQHKTLGQEQMLYCLFKHVSAQLFRDVVVRVGERLVVQPGAAPLLQALAKELGIHISRTAIGKSTARFLPVFGAVTVGAYAYFDTLKVAQTAMELFERDITVDAS